MRRFVVSLLSGLVLAPLPLHAQSVTLDVCDTGTVDIDVFVSRAGSVSSSHIRPSTCAAVAKSVGGGMEAGDSILVNYAQADSGSTVRVLGLDASRKVVFELAYANNGACNTSWNAVPVPFQQLSFD